MPPPDKGVITVTAASFDHVELLPLGQDTHTEYRLVTPDGVSTVEAAGRTFLQVAPEALTLLAKEAIRDIQHLLRSSHLAQLRAIVDDPEASGNDRFVAMDLLRNACISAGGVLPMCQDTGTAIVMGKRTENVLTGGADEAAIARGVFDAYQELNLRYSQLAPVTFWEERNTGTNLPAQIELFHKDGDKAEYEFLFMAKGGGSANKTFLYQETKALLNPTRLARFLDEKLRSLGTAACPPYHLAIVVGGTSAEHNLKVAKLASARYLDDLPKEGSPLGNAFRDVDLEQQVLELTRQFGIGAQFGGKYFCHDVRVIRLPRHGASCPVGIAVSCSADRQAKAKITAEGVFIEQLERDPAQYLPEVTDDELTDEVVHVDLNQPMDQIRALLTTLPVKTRLSLSGPLVVARDIAHAKIKERLDAGEPMPDYLRDHPVYYAGPAKTPDGYASGSFGPTTAGRMDSYVEQFQAAGGSQVMLAKGNRSRQVTEACQNHGGFYLGSIGGPAARLAQDCIKRVEVLEYPELGMEAVWKIEVVDFPAFVVVDDKGNDFFAGTSQPTLQIAFRR
ncbi:fumarate hydratase [Actinophytocola xinjiangensis]|uniref:Fumarate hydratase class I n=1 Tax=Actinophytocola xinjiangensis TaxID=485602 RepID=A0A7Z1B0Y5_9PSEU|nr:fumarate hydratase [Actinophytocola xinjiangensis]